MANLEKRFSNKFLIRGLKTHSETYYLNVSTKIKDLEVIVINKRKIKKLVLKTLKYCCTSVLVQSERISV